MDQPVLSIPHYGFSYPSFLIFAICVHPRRVRNSPIGPPLLLEAVGDLETPFVSPGTEGRREKD